MEMHSQFHEVALPSVFCMIWYTFELALPDDAGCVYMNHHPKILSFEMVWHEPP